MPETTETKMKTIEENFRDWERSAFGFGYGTGEVHVLSALRKFFELLTKNPHCDNYNYDYQVLERELTPPVAWLLINNLCRWQVHIIEYGSSPRYAWLTPNGLRLRDFVLSKTVAQLEEICCSHGSEYVECSPDSCNCGPHGYQKGVKCPNPFWPERNS